MPGLHAGQFATEPYILLTLTSFATCVIFVLAYWLGLRPRSILFGACTFMLLAIAFGLLAITSGPAPTMTRGQVATSLRYMFFAAGVIWAAWLFLLVRNTVTVSRKT